MISAGPSPRGLPGAQFREANDAAFKDAAEVPDLPKQGVHVLAFQTATPLPFRALAAGTGFPDQLMAEVLNPPELHDEPVFDRARFDDEHGNPPERCGLARQRAGLY
jgi:hypothetical protein